MSLKPQPSAGAPFARGASSAKGSSRSAAARRSRGRVRTPAGPRLTSLPTNRGAYQETRRWLLARHGPVCAYCDRTTAEVEITLDHVAPRRGRSAYDRRDNLVLACKACNGAKADMPPMAFLIADKRRAASLLRYGSHLSPLLLRMALSLVPDAVLPGEPGEPGATGAGPAGAGPTGERPTEERPTGDGATARASCGCVAGTGAAKLHREADELRLILAGLRPLQPGERSPYRDG